MLENRFRIPRILSTKLWLKIYRTSNKHSRIRSVLYFVLLFCHFPCVVSLFLSLHSFIMPVFFFFLYFFHRLIYYQNHVWFGLDIEPHVATWREKKTDTPKSWAGSFMAKVQWHSQCLQMQWQWICLLDLTIRAFYSHESEITFASDNINSEVLVILWFRKFWNASKRLLSYSASFACLTVDWGSHLDVSTNFVYSTFIHHLMVFLGIFSEKRLEYIYPEISWIF